MREWLGEQLARAVSEIGAELKQMGAHGSHELAAALFNDSAFVLYPRGHHENPNHGLPEQAQIEQGREM